MVGINKDNFVVFINTVLVDPVRVENAKISTASAHTLFGHRSKATLEFELIDSLSDGFTIGCTYKSISYILKDG